MTRCFLEGFSIFGINRRQLLSALPATVAAAAFARGTVGAMAQEPRFSAASFIDSVGVCTHFSQEQTPAARNFDQIFELLKDLGIRHLRDEAAVAVRSTRNDRGYGRIRKCVASGFSFSMICFDPNNAFVFTPPSMLEALYDWCDGGIEMFEGSNEPAIAKAPWRQPLISKEHQIELFRTVKSSDRLQHIPLAGPSYVQENIALAMEQSAYCDLANIHAYSGMEHPETLRNGSLIKAVGASRRIFGDKPAVVTEIGYHTAVKTTGSFFPVSPEIKVRYLPRTLMWSFKSGMVRTYLYEFVSSFASDPANPESSFGLVTNDLQVTPAYAIIKSMLNLCRGDAAASQTRRPYDGPIDFLDHDPERHSVRLERADGATLLSVWLGIPGWRWPGGTQQAPQERSVRLQISEPERSVVVHRFRDDGTVDATKVQAEDGSYRIAVSDQMSFIEVQ